MVRFYCYYCTAIHFNNLLLNRLRKSHFIWPYSGQAVVNSALVSKRLATPEINVRFIFITVTMIFLNLTQGS